MYRAEKKNNMDVYGQMKAIDLAQSIVHFDFKGNILNANKNFEKLTGYSLSEIRGKITTYWSVTKTKNPTRTQPC